jgi:hypothetical protein
MIRRGFWLTAGAVTGIYGYRRVSALGRRLSASLNPAGSGPSRTPEAGVTQAARLAHRGQRGAMNATREIVRFTRDVREGMELYTARHPAPAGSTLSTDRDSTTYEPKDGH